MCVRLAVFETAAQRPRYTTGSLGYSHMCCSGVCTPSTLLCPSLTATQGELVCLHLTNTAAIESVGYRALVSKDGHVYDPWT